MNGGWKRRSRISGMFHYRQDGVRARFADLHEGGYLRLENRCGNKAYRKLTGTF